MVRRRKFRIFVIIDDFSKRIISYYMDFSISGQKVLEVFENSIKLFSRPRVFRTDNGSEFRKISISSFPTIESSTNS